uniref:RHS repeat domain-containing protein n=1 Tax=Steroidobacter cummioxidans TaxID=1803913 RepID=UPI00137B1350
RWRWDAEPFGGGTVNNNPSGAGVFDFHLRFPGQIYVAETGLNYNYFRDYDPSTGRYAQSDPIGLGGGLNVYGYVNGNPVSFLDPQGLELFLPNPGRNTVICDGNGSMVSQLQPMSPLNEKCVSDCMMLHELTHIDQIIRSGRGRVCRGAARGMRVAMPETDRGPMEHAAYQVERECLQRKLSSLSECDVCRPPIIKRLGQLEGV